MEQAIIVAVKAIILYHGKMLMVQRSHYDEVGADSWEFVGGKLEFGESLTDALKREVIEETALTITIEQLLYATTFKTSQKRQVVVLTYLCHSLSDQVTLSSEHNAFMWADKTELIAYLHPNIIADLVEHNILDELENFK